MYSQELIEQTIKVWQPHYDNTLSDTDAEEIIAKWASYINVIGNALPDILDRQQKTSEAASPKEANDGI